MRDRLGSWRSKLAVLALAVGFVGASPSFAQSRTPDPAAGAPGGRFRALAPGVEVTIKADIKPTERFSVHDLVEMLANDPEYTERKYTKGQNPARAVRFSHEVWALEFTFKPVRFIEVDLPNGLGQLERRLIWYLAYRVKNKGEKPVKFLPVFELYGYTKDANDTVRRYPDTLIPLAIPAIQRREDTSQRVLNVEKVLTDKPARMLNTFEIAGEILPSTETQDNSVWGVATWEGIDPATDRFSIYIRGLTNAYIWMDGKVQDGPPPVYQYKLGEPVGTHREFAQKTLQLNFWRPSDALHQHEQEIRYGAPDRDHGVPGKDAVDYRWVYRKNDGSVVDIGSAAK